MCGNSIDGDERLHAARDDATRGVNYACNTLAIVFARMLCVGLDADHGRRVARRDYADASG